MSSFNVAWGETLTSPGVASLENVDRETANRIMVGVCITMLAVAFCSHFIRTIELFYHNFRLTLNIGLFVGFLSCHFSIHDGIAMRFGIANLEFSVNPAFIRGWMVLIWEITPTFTKCLFTISVILVLDCLFQRRRGIEAMRDVRGFRILF